MDERIVSRLRRTVTTDGRPAKAERPRHLRPILSAATWPDLRVAAVPRIPAGAYTMRVPRLPATLMPFSKPRVVMTWEVVLGPHAGTRLVTFFPIPKSGRVSMRSKYFEAWSIAAGRRPTPADRGLDPAVFLNRLFTCEVRDVTTDWRGRRLPEAERYSVVDRVIARDA